MKFIAKFKLPILPLAFLSRHCLGSLKLIEHLHFAAGDRNGRGVVTICKFSVFTSRCYRLRLSPNETSRTVKFPILLLFFHLRNLLGVLELVPLKVRFMFAETSSSACRLRRTFGKYLS